VVTDSARLAWAATVGDYFLGFFRLFVSIFVQFLRAVSVHGFCVVSCERFVSRERHQPVSHKRRSSVRSFSLFRPTTSVACVQWAAAICYVWLRCVGNGRNWIFSDDVIWSRAVSRRTLIISVLSASFFTSSHKRWGGGVFTAKNSFLSGHRTSFKMNSYLKIYRILCIPGEFLQDTPHPFRKTFKKNTPLVAYIRGRQVTGSSFTVHTDWHHRT